MQPANEQNNFQLAHQVLREGNRGYGILVSSVPKETNAFYSLRNPEEVWSFDLHIYIYNHLHLVYSSSLILRELELCKIICRS
jgi:hypothetical protein